MTFTKKVTQKTLNKNKTKKYKTKKHQIKKKGGNIVNTFFKSNIMNKSTETWRQALLNDLCKINNKHIVAWYNIGDTTKCLVLDKETNKIELKNTEENDNKTKLNKNSSQDDILNAINLKNNIFHSICEILKNNKSDKYTNINNDKILSTIRSHIYQTVEKKIETEVGETNNDLYIHLKSVILPDDKIQNEQKEKEDKETLKIIQDTNNNYNNNIDNCNIINSDKEKNKNYKHFIRSMTKYILYYAFYFYKKSVATNAKYLYAMTKTKTFKKYITDVYTTIKHKLNVNGNITDENICSFISQNITRDDLYSYYKNIK